MEANGVEDDPRWSTRDDLEAEYETIRQAARCWSSDLMKLAGVLLSVGHDGEISATEGVVRTADQKQVEAFRKAGRASRGEANELQADLAEPAASPPLLPKSVVRDLTLARTRAIRLKLSADPGIALAVCVAALAYRGLRRSDLTGVSIATQAPQINDHADLDEARANLESQLPDDALGALDWALGLSRDRLLSALAVLVASSLDLVHDGSSTVGLRLQAIGDRLAQTLDVDMSHYWTADLDYWLRLPKSALLEALIEASDAPAGATERNKMLKSHAKLRKDELAGRIAARLDKTGYLHSLLVTPIAAGCVEVTQAGAEMLAIPSLAAE